MSIKDTGENKMETKDLLIENLERFNVSIEGISRAESDLKAFDKKWFLTFKKKFERDFLFQIIPEMQKLDAKFNKELKAVLEKQGEKFLKSVEK